MRRGLVEVVAVDEEAGEVAEEDVGSVEELPGGEQVGKHDFAHDVAVCGATVFLLDREPRQQGLKVGADIAGVDF